MVVEPDHPTYGRVKTTGTPLKLSETPGRVRWLAPNPGEHNEDVFVGLLGYSRDDLATRRADRVGQPPFDRPDSVETTPASDWPPSPWVIARTCRPLTRRCSAMTSTPSKPLSGARKFGVAGASP